MEPSRLRTFGNLVWKTIALAAVWLIATESLGQLPEARSTGEWRQDGFGFERVEDAASAIFELPQPLASFRSQSGDLGESLDVVVSLTHDVPFHDGHTVRVNEHFTLRSWLRSPKRAVLFLGSALAKGDFWSIPVEGYNGTEMAAKRGFFAYTVDYIGIGESYKPAEGLESTFRANNEALRAVVRYIRFRRAVPRVDLVGEGWGGAHALHLAADSARIRSCVMASMTYRIPLIEQVLQPDYQAFLDSLPNHYLPTDEEIYRQLTAEAPEEVGKYSRATQPGLYLMTYFRDMGGGLPYFDPSVARVPGVVIYGSKDLVEDGRALASDYGDEANVGRLIVLQGGRHAPRLEAPPVAEAYWSHLFDFIDP